MKKSKYLFVLLLLISISVVLLGGTFFYVKLNNKQSDDSELLVMTSCNPVYLATINVVGDADGVTVQNLSQPTTGCLHDYTLTTEDMKNLSKADVLIVNGGGMEGYLEDVVEAYPDLPIIDTFEAVEEHYPVIIEEEAEEEEEDHSHGTSEEHHHDEGTNSHIWMSEEIYAGQVQAIADGLAALDSSNASVYASNADTFISVMDSQIDNQGLDETLSGANVAVLHEAFAYTAQSLGANIVATMDLDEERQVSAGEVSDFINAINENNVQVVFAEYDYGHAMGELITEQTDAKVVYLETLVHGDYSGLDYITVLNKNYAVIKNSL
ncbi:zinc transport system substrate-binding protein [Pseudobutyrivibrio sp. JW11]|uniref:metal ABC transporter substrate-binding protein n=1 Tax=Pseudobutyrivibrio sp. JW11 TaxID=1855302 RepID=UPI0008F11CCF|nr:metal ABC transporter substrate-binding protein [Pseudobutyrivibrio sp. JW11]SFO25465.1 zinc transport system substrate-binding protein [Pseudobutyrivibrio sp. JW11]